MKINLLAILSILQLTTTANAAVQFEVTPEIPNIDDEISVVVSELEPASNYRLELKSDPSVSKGYWKSSAVFTSSDKGIVNLSQSLAISGSYTGVDSMGLFWSMEWQAGSQPHPDFGLAYTVELSVFDAKNVEIGSVSIIRNSCFKNNAIVRTELDNQGVAATLFYPKGATSLPTVLVLSGSEGGKSEPRACQLAEKGFTAISLAYFKYPGLPDYLVEIPLEYFVEELKKINNHPSVDLDRLAVSGGSKGGELALLLGATYPEFKAVVAYVPSAVVWSGIDESGTGPVKSSWSKNGVGLEFLTFGAQDVDFSSPPFALRAGYSSPLANFEAVKASAIQVEQTNGPILLITGDDDQMWPSSTFGDMLSARLAAIGFGFQFQHLRYNNAGHFITAGYLPSTPTTLGPFMMGGTAKGNSIASSDSWPKVISFLNAALAD